MSAAASAVAATAAGTPAAPSEPQANLQSGAKATSLDEPTATAANAAVAEELRKNGDVDGLAQPEPKAEEIRNIERELENLKEREQDARGEAERMADELQRARWVKAWYKS